MVIRKLGVPFNVSGTNMIAATDRKMIIAVPHAHDCEQTDVFNLHKLLNDRQIRRVVTVNALHNACAALPPLEIDCDSCHGSTEVEFDYWHDGNRYTMDSACPVCNGEGKVSNPEAIIKIGDHHIGGYYANLLNELAYTYKCISITILRQDGSTSLFEVGDALAVIAPVHGVSGDVECAAI